MGILNEGNGNGMVLPVTPMGYGGGGGGLFGGDGSIWGLLLVLLLCGNGMWGGYGYAGRERRDGGTSYEYRDGYSGNRGGYSRNRYSRENRNGYSRTGDMHDQLREMMEDAPDDVTRMEIKKLMDKMDQR